MVDVILTRNIEVSFGKVVDMDKVHIVIFFKSFTGP